MAIARIDGLSQLLKSCAKVAKVEALRPNARLAKNCRPASDRLLDFSCPGPFRKNACQNHYLAFAEMMIPRLPLKDLLKPCRTPQVAFAASSSARHCIREDPEGKGLSFNLSAKFTDQRTSC